jgi:dihydrofolate reductase
MRKLVVLTFMSLDGVMQGAGGKGEDPSGGFNLEGWTFPYFDEAMGKEMMKQMSPPFDLLLGRKTYDIFAAHWPNHPEEGESINRATKYVVTNHPVSTEWHGTVPIGGDVVGEIKKLKEQDGPMLQVHGSSVLVQTLLKNDLVDELWLKIFPVTLGHGKRLFGEGTLPKAFKLIASSTTPSGVIMASYKREGEVNVGTFRDE